MSKTSKTIVRREATPPKQSRADALGLARKALGARTDEEDAAITAAAEADPDAQPTDAASRRKVGRPPLARPKRAVQLRLDADVVDGFRAGGDGWQTRMNEALRKAAGL
ncbi:BrnA antitoxin family protein [Mesorhizobium sp. B2-4-2]|uniref:BrnA antitoxin family protein n=1 Tax=Mesorhizobium sp. B2-4-2 TaxID=2589947 RepID=UPI00112CE267|nr:BrnA antitoxin family protein [Mesorhizobium sp. B2-4-2]TPL58695.1 BrnA antitoxin family protein [Mesorhizobium sp. B2-4-2]